MGVAEMRQDKRRIKSMAKTTTNIKKEFLIRAHPPKEELNRGNINEKNKLRMNDKCQPTISWASLSASSVTTLNSNWMASFSLCLSRLFFGSRTRNRNWTLSLVLATASSRDTTSTFRPVSSAKNSVSFNKSLTLGLENCVVGSIGIGTHTHTQKKKEKIIESPDEKGENLILFYTPLVLAQTRATVDNVANLTALHLIETLRSNALSS